MHGEAVKCCAWPFPVLLLHGPGATPDTLEGAKTADGAGPFLSFSCVCERAEPDETHLGSQPGRVLPVQAALQWLAVLQVCWSAGWELGALLAALSAAGQTDMWVTRDQADVRGVQSCNPSCAVLPSGS